MTHSDPDITIYLPPVSDDQVSRDLVWLTEELSKRGSEISGGLLGGEYGYGAYFENETFMMHPFCWCDSDDCPWCLGCNCPDGAIRYFLFDIETDAAHFYSNGGYTVGYTEPVPELQCDHCAGRVQRAPNFLHKASGTRVEWYKYIGRGMEVELRGDWRETLAQCVASIERPVGDA